MKFKEVATSNASTEAKVAALALLLDKELIKLADTVLNVKKLQGPQGEQGLQGPKGEQGDRGFDGTNGKDGVDGKDGKDGKEGKDGVGVQDAKIDFDGSLVITLTNGREINAGDVVPEGAADKIKVVKSGGGNSQTVLDAIEEIQATIATYGTVATQNADAVAITGGSIDGTPIGTTTPAAGTFTTLIGGKDQANYGQITGGATTKAVEFVILGTDVNIAAVIKSKGTGAIDLAAGSRGVNISNGGTVTALTRTVASSGYTSFPSVVISAPTTAGGVQATAVVGTMGNTGGSVVSGGTGYTVNDVLTVVGGTPYSVAATLTVTAVSAGVITSVTPTNFGQYTALPTSPASVTGGTGSGATLNLTWGIGSNPSFTITNAGSGYVEQPTVSFSGGGGSGAAAYATVGSSVTVKSIHGSIAFTGPQNTLLNIADTGNTAQCYMNLQGSNSNTLNYANGAASNVGIYWISKGTGQHSFTTNGSTTTEQLRVAHTASAVNYVQVTGAATGSRPYIQAQGSDTNVDLRLGAKGSGGVYSTAFFVAGAQLFNNVIIQGAATGSSPYIQASGGDTNIDLTLTPKGTGNVRFGTFTANMALVVQGYIEIKDSGGTVRKLAVIA